MMKKHYLGILVVFGLLIAAPAFALDLHEARQIGAVGEKADGYATALKQTPEVRSLVKTVNDKRRQEYARISKANNQPIDVVSALAAQQIVETLKPGEKYQDSAGNWKTR
jgi:uncharacterized protein